jgi:hypothetical protein
VLNNFIKVLGILEEEAPGEENWALDAGEDHKIPYRHAVTAYRHGKKVGASHEQMLKWGKDPDQLKADMKTHAVQTALKPCHLCGHKHESDMLTRAHDSSKKICTSCWDDTGGYVTKNGSRKSLAERFPHEGPEAHNEFGNHYRYDMEPVSKHSDLEGEPGESHDYDVHGYSLARNIGRHDGKRFDQHDVDNIKAFTDYHSRHHMPHNMKANVWPEKGKKETHQEAEFN